MNKVFKIAFLILFITLFPGTLAYADEENVLEEQLNELGIAEEYTDNIAQYITNIDITDEEYNSMVKEGESVLTAVDGKDSITDFKISELYNVYANMTSIMKKLNLSIKIDFKNRQFAVIDKGTNSTLYKGQPHDIEQYYTNYEKLLESGKDALNLEVYIKNLIGMDENNETIVVNANDNESEYEEEQTIVSKPKLEVKETKVNDEAVVNNEVAVNDEVVANEEPEVTEEADINEEEIANSLEEIDKNDPSYIENVEVPEVKHNTKLAMGGEINDRVVYYILGVAIVVLITATGIKKLL